MNLQEKMEALTVKDSLTHEGVLIKRTAINTYKISAKQGKNKLSASGNISTILTVISLWLQC